MSFVLVVALLVGVSLASMDILSSSRAFVGGESLWSKGQKDAVQALSRYAVSRDPADYARFEAALAVPLGDRMAREALNRSPSDTEAARQGFLQGGNHPDDIGGLIRLYRNFRDVGFMAEAITIWGEADALIVRLQALAEALRRHLDRPQPDLAQAAAVLAQVQQLNDELTRLERRFSEQLGEASRTAGRMLVAVTLMLAGLLALTVGWFMHRTLRRQERAEQLRLDKEAAERASRAKDEFLSRVSHELRTPLNAIIGFAQLMQADRADPLSAGQARRVELVLQGGDHLLHLVNDILDLTCVSRGELVLRWRTVDIAEVIRASVNLVEPMARERAVEIHPRLPEPGAEVHTDAVRLQQVFVNLLSNAVKYNPHGGQVEIDCRMDRTHATVSVRDSGPGLTASQLGQLFQPFNRLGAEYTSVPGSGLGLVITRQLLGHLRGSLEVHSQPGQGSCFEVRVPRQAAAA